MAATWASVVRLPAVPASRIRPASTPACREVGCDTTAAGAPSQDWTCCVACSAANGVGRTTGLVGMRMNASSATHANPTASLPDSDASSQEWERSWCAAALSTAYSSTLASTMTTSSSAALDETALEEHRNEKSR